MYLLYIHMLKYIIHTLFYNIEKRRQPILVTILHSISNLISLLDNLTANNDIYLLNEYSYLPVPLQNVMPTTLSVLRGEKKEISIALELQKKRRQ